MQTILYPSEAAKNAGIVKASQSPPATLRIEAATWRLKQALAKANFNPSQPRDNLGKWTPDGNEPSSFELLQTIVYPGDFHDALRDYMVNAFWAAGHVVVTDVSLTLPGVPPVTARLDILMRSPNGTLSGVEVKTGNDPKFTPAQAIVYPHAIGGAGVISFDSKIKALGLTPGEPLRAFGIVQAYSKGPGAKIEPEDLRAEPF